MREPDQTVTVTIPEEWNKWSGGYCTFATTRDKTFMTRHWEQYPAPPTDSPYSKRYEQWRREYNAETKKHRSELYTVDETGSLDLVNQFNWTEPSRAQHLLAYDKSPYRLLGRYLTVISPPAYKLFKSVLRGPLLNQIQYGIIREVSRAMAELEPRNFPLSLFLSAAMTTLVFFHAWPRRTSNAMLAFWLVFTLLFSLAGLLTYLALNYTPTIKCTSCGKRRGFAQPECPHCNAPLPRPKPRELDLILTS